MAQAAIFPPGLQGYVAMRDANSELDQRNISGLAKMQAMADAQYKMGLENEYRQKIATATTPQERLAITQQYMGPDALGQSLQNAQTRQAQIAATREASLTRIQNSWDMFTTRMEEARKRADTAEKMAIWNQQFKIGHETHAAAWRDAQAVDLTGEHLPRQKLPAPLLFSGDMPTPGAPAATPNVPPGSPPGGVPPGAPGTTFGTFQPTPARPNTDVYRPGLADVPPDLAAAQHNRLPPYTPIPAAPGFSRDPGPLPPAQPGFSRDPGTPIPAAPGFSRDPTGAAPAPVPAPAPGPQIAQAPAGAPPASGLAAADPFANVVSGGGPLLAAAAPAPAAPAIAPEGDPFANVVEGTSSTATARAAPTPASKVPPLPDFKRVTPDDAPPEFKGTRRRTAWAMAENNDRMQAALQAQRIEAQGLARAEGGGILNTMLRRQEAMGREIAPHRKVFDAYERYQGLVDSGDNSQANLFIAKQIQQMTETNQRAFSKWELETTLGSGPLGGNWWERISNAASQYISGVRTPELDKQLKAAAQAMAIASANRTADAVKNARALVPSNANPDDILPRPLQMGRFVILPDGTLKKYDTREQAEEAIARATARLGIR